MHGLGNEPAASTAACEHCDANTLKFTWRSGNTKARNIRVAQSLHQPSWRQSTDEARYPGLVTTGIPH